MEKEKNKMRRLIFMFSLTTICSVSFIFSQENANNDPKTAVQNTALDYIEGWYSGDAERMDRALHPDLAKRGVFENAESGKTTLRPIDKARMVEATKAGVGKKPQEQWGIELTIQDIYHNTACVKIVSVDFIDFAQLAKIDGQWKIVNVLWEPVKK